MKTTADEIRETIANLCHWLRDTPEFSPSECAKVTGFINTLSAALINTVNADKAQGEVGVESGAEDIQQPVEGYLVHWLWGEGGRYSQFRETMKGARTLADTLAGFSYRGLTISEVHKGETVWADKGAAEDVIDGHRAGVESDIGEETLVKEDGIDGGQWPVVGYLVQWPQNGNNWVAQFRPTKDEAQSLADTLAGFPFREVIIYEVHRGKRCGPTRMPQRMP